MARSRTRRTLEAAALWVGVFAILPLAPFAYVAALLGARRQRRRIHKFRVVSKIEREGPHFQLLFADGASLRLDLSRITSATWEDWGDGINGSLIDRGLTLDRLRVRFDGWSKDFDPLIAALRARGHLSESPKSHTHPNEPLGYLFFAAAFGALIDALALAIWLRFR
jgi:hypothetical protein